MLAAVSNEAPRNRRGSEVLPARLSVRLPVYLPARLPSLSPLPSPTCSPTPLLILTPRDLQLSAVFP